MPQCQLLDCGIFFAFARSIKRMDTMAEENKELTEEQVTAQATEEQTTEETTTEETVEVEVQEEVSASDQIAELNQKYLRLYSDFENFRKRTQKEKLDTIQQANANLLKDLLTVVDDFERAIKSNEKSEDLKGLKEGFGLISNKFFGILEKQGLKAQEAKGEVFDADKHEALTNIPAPSKDLKGKIVDVIEQGYTLNDKILRYAKVVVGN